MFIQASNDRVKRSLLSQYQMEFDEPVENYGNYGSDYALPYPRIGKRSKIPDISQILNQNLLDKIKREPTGMIPMARIGKRQLWAPNTANPDNNRMIPMARIGRNDISMIPMARIGKRFSNDPEDKYSRIPMPRIG